MKTHETNWLIFIYSKCTYNVIVINSQDDGADYQGGHRKGEQGLDQGKPNEAGTCI